MGPAGEGQARLAGINRAGEVIVPVRRRADFGRHAVCFLMRAIFCTGRFLRNNQGLNIVVSMCTPTFNKTVFFRRISALLMCVVALLLSTSSIAANDDRVALVIGNDQYPSDPLRNAVNDAQAVAKTLSDLGFKVMIKTNADYATMRGVAVEFAKVMEGATAAVFFYAGHGIQYRGQNYLIPTDAKLTSEASIAFNAMPVTQILDTMDDAKVRHKFIILDACRNNPFSNVFSSTGLAKIQAPPGTIVSFAAAAGQVAPDGADGVNSLYTTALVREMRDPQQQAAAMFQRVQTYVAQESMFKQLPELHNTPLFRIPFFFAERGAQTATAAAPAPGLSGDAQAAIEGEFWRSAKEGRRIEGFQAYVEKYPNGNFASLARLEIDRLKRERSQQQVAATPLSAGNASVPSVFVPESSAVLPAPVPSPAPALVAEKAQALPAKTVIASAAPVPASQTNDSRGIEIKPANTVSVSQKPIEAAPAMLPTAPSTSPIAPGFDKVASVSPEQRTTLPPVPAVAKVLAGLIQFPGGATYNGEYKENKDKLQILHGQGEFISSSVRYKGEFRENKKQGKGVYIWANGDRYEGDFVDDEPSGRGKFIFASGDQYEGEYSKGAFNGKGMFIAKNGDRTDGAFVNNKANGQAVYVFASGDRYEGEMAAGKMSGKGKFTTKGGDRWEATFVNDQAHGTGVYYFSNGDRYEGEFTSGAMTGKGAYFYSTGYKSEGSYVNAQLNGEGKFHFNDGGWFEGFFEQGLKRAKGFSVSKDGTKRSATMVDGQIKLDGG